MEPTPFEAFCDRWLSCWTGNDPAALVSFYAENATYRDPARPNGLQGRAEILPYFAKLLAANAAWIWKREEVIPTQNGFILKWRAKIPVKNGVIRETGVDIIELNDEMLITRNEIYFDRTAWIKAM